jgi:hypothetical protein
MSIPKGVFSIFTKDPLLIYDLVIFITVVYLIVLLLLNNFEFCSEKNSQTSDQTSTHCYLFSSFNWPSLLKQQEDKDNVYM